MTEQPEVLITEEEIQKRVQALGAQISEDYKDVDDVYMLGVLPGGIHLPGGPLARPHRAAPRSRRASTSPRQARTRG